MDSLVMRSEIGSRIVTLRGEQVMLDRDIAEPYEVETKRLNEQVRRNIERFPEDFMFQLTDKELDYWRSHFATSNKEIMGLRKKPYVFTEQGIYMLASVLKSPQAVAVNIAISDTTFCRDNPCGYPRYRRYLRSIMSYYSGNHLGTHKGSPYDPRGFIHEND